MFCNKCGAQIPDGSTFCSSCGQPLAGGNVNNQQSYNAQPNYNVQPNYNAQPNYGVQQNYGVQSNYGMENTNTSPMDDKEAMRIFLGKNAQYYLDKFDDIKLSGKNGWNGTAWFFSAFWFIYRKMYGIGCGILGVFLLLGFIDVKMFSYSETPFWMRIIEMIIWIGLGTMANRWYMQYAERKIEESKMLPEQIRVQALMKNGGTSPLAVVIAVVIYCAINLIFAYI